MDDEGKEKCRQTRYHSIIATLRQSPACLTISTDCRQVQTEPEIRTDELGALPLSPPMINDVSRMTTQSPGRIVAPIVGEEGGGHVEQPPEDD